MTKLWGKSPEQIEAERQRMVAEREARQASEALERDKALQARLNEGRTPEELGAYYSSYMPPDAPMVLEELGWSPAMSVDDWVDQREEPAYICIGDVIVFPKTGKNTLRKPTGWSLFLRLAVLAVLLAAAIGVALELVRFIVSALS